jgi:large subunit ribosomal protein L4
LALRSALTVKGSGDQIKVIEDFDFAEPSTKSFRKILDACGLNDQKLLFITAENAPTLVKSSRNLPKVNIAHLGSLGTYDLLRADIVLFTHQAFDKFVETHRQEG